MAGTYVAMPAADDVAGQLRHLAQRIADGDVERPARALVILYDAQGIPETEVLGTPYPNQREAIAELAAAILSLNAEAST